MLYYYGISEKKEELKRWYDGYLFGNTEVYNSWSVVNYIKTAITNQIAFPKPYWSNTSSNSIIKELIETADSSVRKEIEELIAGKEIKNQCMKILPMLISKNHKIIYGTFYSLQDI